MEFLTKSDAFAELTQQDKRAVLNEQIALYTRSLYRCSIDFRVGQALGDENAMKAAKDNAAKCQQALDIIEAEIKSLSNGHMPDLSAVS